MNIIEWTHTGVKINDVRKVKNFYVISVDKKEITSTIFVDINIFEGRLKSYYLKDNMDDISRQEVLGVKWNMVINKGYFIKYGKDGETERIDKSADKFYISFLEIDGPLGIHVPKKLENESRTRN
jgi:hypothetical protein